MMTPRYFKFVIFCFCLTVFCFCKAGTIPEKPSEAIEINPNIFLDETETTVVSWMIYYRWKLGMEGVKAAAKVLPDSAVVEPIVWRFIRNTTARYIRSSQYIQKMPLFASDQVKKSKELPSPRELRFVLYYLLDYDKELKRESDIILYSPITGISYEQAIDYCRWKTKMFGNNEWVYCLPTQSDWELISRKMMTEKEWNNRMKDSVHYHKEREAPNFNYRYPAIKPLEGFEASVMPVTTYFAHEILNSSGFFGNVSEMTNVKGLAKGGNYASPAVLAHLDYVQHYDKPERWLGFRCVIKSVKVVEKDKLNIEPIGKNEIEDKRDNKRYKTVTIGSQTWMAENLAYKSDSGVCNALYNDDSYVPLYGYLYSWETSQNICPSGWRLPDSSDYARLLQGLNVTDSIQAYKELSVHGSSGLLLVEGVLRIGKNFSQGEYSGPGFWLSEEKSKREGACVFAEPYPSNHIPANPRKMPKKYGLPVRCIKE